MADVGVNKIIDESMARIPARVAKIMGLYQWGLYQVSVVGAGIESKEFIAYDHQLKAVN